MCRVKLRDFESTIVYNNLEIEKYSSIAENPEVLSPRWGNVRGEVNTLFCLNSIFASHYFSLLSKTSVTKGYFDTDSRAQWEAAIVKCKEASKSFLVTDQFWRTSRVA
jgi:hypothetical protein